MIAEEKSPEIKGRIEELLKQLRISLLRDGKSISLNAWGSSMYPFIKNGDRIKIEPIDEKRKIVIGDIIAVDSKYEAGSRLIVHRVVKISEEYRNAAYYTKGDAHANGLDGPFIRECIVGKITQIQRNGLEINLELSIYRYTNSIIAKLSFHYPKLLQFLARYISLLIEWRLFFSKVRNKLTRGDTVLYNTEQLLLICSRKVLNEKLKQEAIDLIKEGVYWTHFCELSMRMGVTVLVYNMLKMIAPFVRIPEFVFERLKSATLFIVSRTASQHRELISIMGLLAKEGIPVIVLKGQFLAERLYADISIRGISLDFDFLVREEDKNNVKDILERAGYQYAQGDDVREWRWQCIFTNPKATMIDLHWDITMMVRSKERIEGLWKGARLVEKGTINYYEFKEEELLLYLSAHLVSSGCCTQLRYICDINELLHRYKDTLNWDEIIEKAGRWRLSNSLYTTLKLSNILFASDLPFGLLHKLKPHFFTLILINVFIDKKVILRKDFRRNLINSFLSYIFFELVEARSAKDYFSIFKRVFFPPKEAIGNRNHILRIINGIKKHLLQ